MHVLDAVLGQLVGDLHDRHHLRGGALGDCDGVADVVRMAMRQQDRLRTELIRGYGRLRVARQKRVDQHGGGAIAELERRVA